MVKPALTDLIEALLFVANDPLSLEQICQLTGHEQPAIETALHELGQARAQGGLRLLEHHGSYRLATAPAADAVIRRYLETETRSDLTRPALETLAIIAYRGPLTKSQLEELRGVSSDTMIRNLLQRGLIAEHGRSPEPGKPVLYSVSHTFLEHFGLRSLSDLPPLEEPAAP